MELDLGSAAEEQVVAPALVAAEGPERVAARDQVVADFGMRRVWVEVRLEVVAAQASAAGAVEQAPEREQAPEPEQGLAVGPGEALAAQVVAAMAQGPAVARALLKAAQVPVRPGQAEVGRQS